MKISEHMWRGKTQITSRREEDKDGSRCRYICHHVKAESLGYFRSQMASIILVKGEAKQPAVRVRCRWNGGFWGEQLKFEIVIKGMEKVTDWGNMEGFLGSVVILAAEDQTFKGTSVCLCDCVFLSWATWT